MKFNPSAVNSFTQKEDSMQKTRATTLQSKLGFQDADLTSPVHDALMVWLDQNVESRLMSKYPAEWPQEKVDAAVGKAKANWLSKIDDSIASANSRLSMSTPGAFFYDNAVDERDKFIEKRLWVESWNPTLPDRIVRLKSKTWEKPIMARNNFLVGFVDMEVIIERNTIEIVNDEWRSSTVEDVYLFEVKPTIPSVGELIRQVRMYQEYRAGKYVVVSPDDRFQSILADQQIHFMKADI